MRNVKRIKIKSKVTATIVTTTTLLSLATILVLAVISTPLVTMAPLQSASAQSFIDREGDLKPEPKAPMAVSSPDGQNVYIVWWTNKSENWEVMFRASNDGGQTFGDKINLSNSSDTESQNAEIVAAGDSSVYVSWWETSPETGSSESVLRVSRDGGQTFGPVVMLGMNGTINTTGNTTITTTATTEGGGQQQCQLDVTTNQTTFQEAEPVAINVTNGGDESLEFPDSVLGLEIENRDTGEVYPLLSAQVITTLERGESRTFEFSYDELVSEIGAGTIETSVSSGNGCSTSTTFTLSAPVLIE